MGVFILRIIFTALTTCWALTRTSSTSSRVPSSWWPARWDMRKYRQEIRALRRKRATLLKARPFSVDFFPTSKKKGESDERTFHIAPGAGGGPAGRDPAYPLLLQAHEVPAAARARVARVAEGFQAAFGRGAEHPGGHSVAPNRHRDPAAIMPTTSTAGCWQRRSIWISWPVRPPTAPRSSASSPRAGLWWRWTSPHWNPMTGGA